MDTQSLLNACAMQYGTILSQKMSAEECAMPASIITPLNESLKDAATNLLEAARQYFDARFDGGEE